MLLEYSKNSIIGAGLAVLLVPLIFFPFLGNVSFALREGFVALLGILTALGLLGVWYSKDKLSLGRPNNLTWSLLGFGGALVISGLANTTLLSPVKSLSVSPRGSGFAMILLLFSALIVGLFWNKKQWSWFGKGLLGVSFLVSLSAFLAFRGVDIFEKLLGISGSEAVLFNTNQAGIFAGLGFFLGLALFWASRREKRFLAAAFNPFWEKVVLFLVTALCGLIVVTLGAHFILLPLFFALAVLIYFLTQGLKNKKIVGLSFLLLLVLLLAVVGPNWRLKWTQITSEVRLSQRAGFEVMKSYIKHEGIRSALFGEGWGSYQLLYESYRPASITSSSLWQISLSQSTSEFWVFLAETGLVGMIVFLSLFGRGIILLVKKLKKARRLDPLKTRNFYGLLFAASSVYLTAVFFMYPFGLGLWALYLFSLSGFGALFFQEEKEMKFSLAPVKKVALGLLVLGSCLLLGVYPIRQAAANVFLGRAQKEEAAEAKNWNYEMARRILPSYPRSYMVQSEELFKEASSAFGQEGQDEQKIKGAEEKLNKALTLSRKAVSLDSQDPQLPLLVSEMYLRSVVVADNKERVQEIALNYINLADQLAPTSPKPPHRRARVLLQVANRAAEEGEEEKEKQILNLARQSLNQSLTRAPNFALAGQALTEIAFHEGEYEKVIEEGKKFLNDHPDNLTVRQKVAQSYYELDQFNEAYSQLETILDKDQSYLPALYTAGKVTAFMGDYSKSVDYFSQVKKQVSGTDEKLVSGVIEELKNENNPFEESQEEPVETPQVENESAPGSGGTYIPFSNPGIRQGN